MEGTGFKPSITLLWKGLSAIADERCRTDKLDGVIKHRSSRETTMVGRGASLDGRLFLSGTDGSNPVPSSAESAANRFRHQCMPTGSMNRRLRTYVAAATRSLLSAP